LYQRQNSRTLWVAYKNRNVVSKPRSWSREQSLDFGSVHITDRQWRLDLTLFRR